MAYEQVVRKQTEQAVKGARRGKGQPSPTSRRLTGQDALDALQGSRWGQLFQR